VIADSSNRQFPSQSPPTQSFKQESHLPLGSQQPNRAVTQITCSK